MDPFTSFFSQIADGIRHGQTDLQVVRADVPPCLLADVTIRMEVGGQTYCSAQPAPGIQECVRALQSLQGAWDVDPATVTEHEQDMQC